MSNIENKLNAMCNIQFSLDELMEENKLQEAVSALYKFVNESKEFKDEDGEDEFYVEEYFREYFHESFLQGEDVKEIFEDSILSSKGDIANIEDVEDNKWYLHEDWAGLKIKDDERRKINYLNAKAIQNCLDRMYDKFRVLEQLDNYN
jgi:hypothetical protein